MKPTQIHLVRLLVIVLLGAACVRPDTTLLAAGTAATRSAEHADYVKKELRKAEAAIKEAQRRARQEYITRSVEDYKKTGRVGIVLELAQTLTADEGLPVFSSLLADLKPEVKAYALFGLKGYGAKAATVLDKILPCYSSEQEEVAWRAAEAIASMGAEAKMAVGPLSQQLRSGQGSERLHLATVMALGKIGPGASEALPILEKELAGKNSETAYQAYLAIGVIRNEPPLPYPALMSEGAKVFLGRDGFRAFQALRKEAVNKDAAAAVLRELLQMEPPLPQRIMALETMGQLRPDDPDSIRALLQSTDSADGPVADTAAGALAKCPMTSEQAMEALVPALAAKTNRIAVEGAAALARFGPKAARLVPEVIASLQRCAGPADYQKIGAYLHVLRKVGPSASAATPLLTSQLVETAPIYHGMPSYYAKSIRKYLLLTLADIGITAEAIPAVIDELVNAREASMIAAAARATGALPSGHDKVLPFLQEVLRKKGLDSAVDLETISETLQRGKPMTSAYLEAIHALARIGLAAKGAVPLLRERAKDPIKSSPYYPPYQQAAAGAAEALSQ